MTAQGAPAESRLPVVDGIRGLAILLVMQYHFWGLAFVFYPKDDLISIDNVAAKVAVFGWAGVDLFLVLSGFLITGILYEAKGATRGYFRNFYGRRFLRIFPLYYAFVVFMLFVMPQTGWMSDVAATDTFSDNQGWFWAYLVNVAASVPDLNAEIPLVHAHIWTLSLEEQFYILWPFVVLVLNRRWLMIVCAVAPVAALAFRIAVVEGAFGSLFYINAAHVLLPARFDCLALGAFVALAAVEPGGLRGLARAAPYVAALSALTLAGVFAWQGGIEVLEKGTLTIGFTAGALLACSVLVLAITSDPRVLLCRFLAHPIMTAFGTYSYCMYIIHLLVGFELGTWLIREDYVRTLGGSQLPFNLAFNAGATALCFSIAFVSWHAFEKQVLRLKVLFPRSRPDVLEEGPHRAAEPPQTAAVGSG